MRLVSWNLAYMKPGAFKTIDNRRRQWALLAALLPDVALLQECRPDDIAVNGPSWMANLYDVVGDLPDQWTACSAVLVRKSLHATALDRTGLPEAERRWLEYLSGYVATAVVSMDGRETTISSVHTIAKQVDDPSVTDADHERVRRRALDRAWHNDLAVAALTPWLEGRPFIVGGDWNNALLFDTTYPLGAEGGPMASAEFFANRSSSDWHHALRKFHPDEVRTYLDPASAPYELDHVFTDKSLHERLNACAVVDAPGLGELSDHAPLIAEFAP